ncbi:MAG: tRNA adenosine(34) deaminase TadA [Desulfobacterales bacterium]|nr:tRNA adenosine(34) deaminase TadA [Desulfobacterales bacterium]
MALLEARKAFDEDEVPVGAVLVDQKGDVLSTGRNRTIYFHDPSAHAEILAIRAAGQKLKNYRILNTTLYVTVEPCVMCMGAIIHARIGCLVFGAYDSKWGAVGSVYEFDKDHRFNHRPDIFKGVCEAQCRQLMVDFFKIKRCGGLLDNNQDRYII